MNFLNLMNREMCALLPYGILVGGAVLVLMLSVLKKGSEQTRWLGFLTAAISISAVFQMWNHFTSGYYFEGLLKENPTTLWFSTILLLILALVSPSVSNSRESFSDDAVGTTLALLLFSAVGGMLMIQSNELLVFFVGLEILSLPLYVLCGLGRNQSYSSESAFKYFLLGSLASALFIFGVALLWSAVGTLQLHQLSAAIEAHTPNSSGLLLISVSLIVAGLAFKLGLSPFHMWIPDVYEGAPSFVVAWMSSAVKVAVLGFAVEFVNVAFPAKTFDLTGLFVALSMISMIWGSLGALGQENVKRMLAYSTIANAGYSMLGILAAHRGMGQESTHALVYFLLGYGAANAICFLILAMEGERRTHVSDWAGLAKRRPGLAFVFAVALLSLAGLPPFIGFIGKFNLFALAVQSEHLELVFVGVVATVISVAYYLRIIVAMYMQEPQSVRTFDLKFGFRASLVVAVLIIVLLGLFPGWMFQAFAK